MRIIGIPCKWTVKSGKKIGAAGPKWLESLAPQWVKALQEPEKHIVLDISNIEFFTFFEWTTIVAILNKLLTSDFISTINIDLISSSDSSIYINLLSPQEYLKYKKEKRSLPDYKIAEYELSEKVYRIVGFLESLGTRAVLNRPSLKGRVLYPGIEKVGLQMQSFYTSKYTESATVILGLTRIETKGDCKKFLDERQILNWRNAMEERFSRSPIFESEEIWRVLCHELAVNIWEHSDVSGFLSARIVEPFNERGRIKWWCRNSFAPALNNLWPNMKHGFLELCIADAGIGFLKTLENAYRQNCNLKDTDRISPEDILSFAFDELGTCKAQEERWITERHALGRILFIVSKYGGVITLRSDGREVSYISQGDRFKKNSGRPGYKPTKSRPIAYMPGAQIQIILPMIPISSSKPTSKRHSVLEYILPKSFRTEDSHVLGHLIPLLEALDEPEPCLGRENQRRFRNKCINLCKQIVETRPQDEPLVLDFSNLKWKPEQFETFLYLLQNVLQNRSIILVEINPQLAQAVINLEEEASATQLPEVVYPKSRSVTGRAFGEPAEYRFMETFSRIHVIILGVDSDGRKYIFGLLDHRYEEPLLSLIDNPRSIKELCEETYWGEIEERTLRAILHFINPLFQSDESGHWGCAWNPRQLANEVKRAMSRHFDALADRTEAWRGRDYNQEIEQPVLKKFNLSWQEEWRKDFLEASRFLSRERYVDEAAQRLLFRLRKGLELDGKSLKDVKVLACVTGPAMMLATALHRWWPLDSSPIVTDFGYYVLLGRSKNLPAIVKEGGVVIIQDILDTQRVSGKLKRVLDEQNVKVLCILGLIRLVSELTETRVTSIGEGWLPQKVEKSPDFFPTHAMIEVKSPEKCEPLADDEDDSNAFWIEPRSLHPVRYKTLRRDFPQERDPDLARRDQFLKRFDSDHLIAAGHYVFGRKHFISVINLRKTLEGRIGDEIAMWLADICEGKQTRDKVLWERNENRTLKGDVTAVLMPLHSQIHYLWPKITNLLTQRGRRQPLFLLDASLFTGRAPAYRIQSQFRYQIEKAFQDAITALKAGKVNDFDPLRILILDDAIATARTAETILLAITQEVRKQINIQIEKHKDIGQELIDKIHQIKPIEWIRYFAVLNQMEYAQHMLWRNLKLVGDPPIPFLFEDYAPFMGVSVYDENDCPLCSDRLRLENLKIRCEQCEAHITAHWVTQYIKELIPLAIDAPENIPEPTRLSKGINILASRSRFLRKQPNSFTAQYADTAIWRFYELMYLSYPPEDVLRSLEHARADTGPNEPNSDEEREYERYRWSVFGWCLKNWERVKANSARQLFLECAIQEIKDNTQLVEKILEGCLLRYRDHFIQDLIKYGINSLAELEKQRWDTDSLPTSNRDQRIGRLNIGLSSFFLNSVPENLEVSDLIKELETKAQELDIYELNLLRILLIRLTRPPIPDPKWALNIIAESLYRGRNHQHGSTGQHHLLPRLINNRLTRPSTAEDDLLLEGGLSVFLAALEDISHFVYLDSANNIKSCGKEVLDWLKKSKEKNLPQPDSLRWLGNAIDLETGTFVKNFNEILHEEVENLRVFLEKERPKDSDTQQLLSVEYQPDEDIKTCSVLTLVHRLKICLANYAIDPIKNRQSKHRSRIIVKRQRAVNEPEKLVFRILTDFDKPQEASKWIERGRSITGEHINLEKFGVEFEDPTAPSKDEENEGFLCVIQVKVLSGYQTRRNL